MAKFITQVLKTDTLTLNQLTDGFWLYDNTRGFNLAMSANTKDDAFIEALQYYQNKLKQREAELNALQNKVLGFVSQFVHEVDYGSSTDIPNTVLEICI